MHLDPFPVHTSHYLDIAVGGEMTDRPICPLAERMTHAIVIPCRPTPVNTTHAPTVCKGTWRTSAVWHRTRWTELTYRAMLSDRFLKFNSELFRKLPFTAARPGWNAHTAYCVLCGHKTRRLVELCLGEAERSLCDSKPPSTTVQLVVR